MGSDRRFRRIRAELHRIAAEAKRNPPPRWRLILARIGFRRQLVRWLGREERRRDEAIKYATKKTSHKAVGRV